MLAPENSIYSFIQQTLLGTYQKPGIGIDTIDMNMNKRTPAFTEQQNGWEEVGSNRCTQHGRC